MALNIILGSFASLFKTDPPLSSAHSHPDIPTAEAIIDQEDLEEEAIMEQTPPNSFLSRVHVLHMNCNLHTSLILTETFYTHS